MKKKIVGECLKKIDRQESVKILHYNFVHVLLVRDILRSNLGGFDSQNLSKISTDRNSTIFPNLSKSSPFFSNLYNIK